MMLHAYVDQNYMHPSCNSREMLMFDMYRKIHVMIQTKQCNNIITDPYDGEKTDYTKKMANLEIHDIDSFVNYFDRPHEIIMDEVHIKKLKV